MTNFTYSTELSIQGPWLLSRSALEELDQILERMWLDHQQQKQKAIDEKVAQMVSERRNRDVPPSEDDLATFRQRADSYEYRCKRSVVVHFSATKSLQAETVREALSELVASDERPNGVTVGLTVGQLEASVSVGQGTFGSDRLRMRVSPETTSAARELFGSLRQWAETHQSPAWQRVWASVGGFLWYPWLIVLWLVVATLPDQERAAKAAAHQAADILLRDGITPNETPAAIELLLRLATGRIIAPSTPALPRWFWVLLVVGFISTVVLHIRPKAVIGMGSGEAAIRRWRTWLRIVGVTIPSAVLGSIVLPYISEAFRLFVQN